MNLRYISIFIFICTALGCDKPTTIQLSDPQGEPLPNTLVVIQDKKGSQHEDTTDIAGAATFEHVASGPYTVSLPETPGWPTVVESQYEIQLLDTVKSIARNFNVLPSHILESDKNKAYFAEFPDPDVMMPGRSITIPAQAKKLINGTDRTTHITTDVIEPDFFRLQVQIPGRSDVSGIRVVFYSGEFTYEAILDTTGLFEVQLPEKFDHNAKIEFYYNSESEAPFFTQHTLLGAMLPYNTLGGTAARLSLLGWEVTISENDTLEEPSRTQVKQFQKQYDIQPTGELDPKTMEKVKEVYGF